MLPVRADRRCADAGTTVEITVVDFRHRNPELPVHFRNHRPNHGALLFEGVYIAEENVEFKSSDPHMDCNSSVCRTEATELMSDGPGRYAVQSSSLAAGDDETMRRRLQEDRNP